MRGRGRLAERLAALPLALLLAAPGPITADPPAQAPADAPADPRALTYGPLSISFPKPGKVLLPNGLLVYLFEDHELPLVDVTIDVKAGSIFDPPEKAGLASLAATMMRTGGTATMTPDAVDEALEFMAAQISLHASADMLGGSVSAVKDRFPEALRIFASLLRAPRFDAGRL